MSWWDPVLTFDLAVVTLNFKSCLSYMLETMRCRKLLLRRNTGLGLGIHITGLHNF